MQRSRKDAEELTNRRLSHRRSRWFWNTVWERVLAYLLFSRDQIMRAGLALNKSRWDSVLESVFSSESRSFLRDAQTLQFRLRSRVIPGLRVSLQWPLPVTQNYPLPLALNVEPVHLLELTANIFYFSYYAFVWTV